MKNTLTKSFLWSAIERFSNQFTQLFIGIILARILSPKDYGVIGILLVIIAFLQVFIDSGFTKALIQRRVVNEVHINSVFGFNLIISVICYAVLFFLSPYLEMFYEIESLSKYIRIIGLVMILYSLYSIIQTIFIIELNFKVIAIVNLTSNIISGVVAIILAYSNFGVWSLIVQTILKAFVVLVMFLYFSERKFVFSIDFKVLKELFGFGNKLLFNSLLSNIINNFAIFFVGKYSSASDLGFFTRGTQFVDVAFNTFNSIIDNVLFPILSKVNDDIGKVKEAFLNVYKSSSVILVPIFVFIALLSEPIIRIILTEKWLFAVPIMQIFSIARLITIFSGMNLSILNAIGRSDLVLKQQYFKVCIRLSFLILSLQYGIYYVALAELISTVIHFFINTYYPGKILRISGFKQLLLIKDVFVALIMLLMSYFLLDFFMNFLYVNYELIVRILIVSVSLSFYVGTLYFFKNNFIIKIIKNKTLNL